MTDIEALSGKPTHCTYEYAYDMYGAYCAGLRLTKVPSLRSGIEILDFSDNKLQELHSDTLSSYTSIKFLYLAENQIYSIDEDALTSFTSLLTLDLSNNVILQLPNSIFQLPSLRKLYLKGNPLLHLRLNDLMITRPIKAPLELLDISDCKIKELPQWGPLPQLIFYNISHNPLTTLDADHFAAMCNLAKVDLTESINDFKLCNLKPTVSWFQEKGVFFQLQDYTKLNSIDFQNCPQVNNSVMYNATYHRCKADYLEVQNIKASRRTWLTIGGGLAGFLVGFILLLYIMHRHNVSQIKNASKVKKVRPAADGDKQTTAILLNDVSQ
ncbi:hypothetical protein O3G_MSEX011005 [Manduca sexta]|uniref:Uncharacterized protein n=1 Tax=Manduca sexta TaxID=7130 RepID=A0A921ZIL5_MANSE|nr:hypothetical protein O3G_MSEX011005 [Manduca sexta]KAG6458698.1 hypothetical protein O3G_MSEX011005 [Manduca sexta]